MIRKLAIFVALLSVFAAPALADANIRVVVPARDIARGEVLASSDLTFGTFTGAAMMGGTITSMDAATGTKPAAFCMQGKRSRPPICAVRLWSAGPDRHHDL